MPRVNRKHLLVLTLAVLISFPSCSGSKAGPAPVRIAAKTPAERKLAPDFKLTDAGGQAVKLSDFRGKVILLNFWATWCGPCGMEIPWFQEFQQQYKSKGFEVIGVSMDEDGWSAIKPYVAARKINYRILLGDDTVSQLYGGVDSLPTTFIIDRDGKLAFPPNVGLAEKNEYNSEIQSALAEKEGTAAHLVVPAPAALFSTAK